MSDCNITLNIIRSSGQTIPKIALKLAIKTDPIVFQEVQKLLGLDNRTQCH
jgi:hypothetical protein